MSASCPIEKSFELIDGSTAEFLGSSSVVSCRFRRNFEVDSSEMIDINPGQIINYRVGFNIYDDQFGERKSWAYSETLSGELPRQQSLTGTY